MQIHLLCIGNRMPDWVSSAYDDYAKRLPAHCRLNCIEIPAMKRPQHADLAKITQTEGDALLANIPKGAYCIALDEKGQHWSTKEVSQQLTRWQALGCDVALLVGGPDGLSDAVRARAQQTWSLSALTFPHPLVRVILAEQLYRACSLLSGHPYHRA